MRVKFDAKTILSVTCVALGLTMATFFWPRTVDRRMVEKDAPPFVAAGVEGRGWPLAFIVDDPNKGSFEYIGKEDRIFPLFFVADVFILFLLAMAASVGLAFLKKPKK